MRNWILLIVPGREVAVLPVLVVAYLGLAAAFGLLLARRGSWLCRDRARRGRWACCERHRPPAVCPMSQCHFLRLEHHLGFERQAPAAARRLRVCGTVFTVSLFIFCLPELERGVRQRRQRAKPLETVRRRASRRK